MVRTVNFSLRLKESSLYFRIERIFRVNEMASATRFISIVFRFYILVTAINTLYATYVVKTCNALSPYA